MSTRSSSLQATNTLAINREIDSKYDAVIAVRDKLTEIELVAGLDIAQILTELQNTQDFTGIKVVTGSTAGWDATTKTITVPTIKGDQGIQGPTGATGATGAVGQKGDRGSTGATGANGRDGINGRDGVDGLNGRDGIDGKDLTIEQISYDSGTGRFVWQFSDGTSYETPDLRGEKGATGDKGDKGDQGISVHHIKGTSTTNVLGDFATYGDTDTYTIYGDAAETINLGYFRINNGMAKDGQYNIMYGSTYDANSSGIVDNSEKLEGKTLYEVQDFANIHSKPSTLSGYGIGDAFTKAEVTTSINSALAGLVNGAPAALDTLNELSNALANDANFATTIANNIGDKVTKNTAIMPGTNTLITYDSKGLVTGGSTPTTLAGYSINNAYTKVEGDARYESKNVNIQNHIASTSNPHGVTKAQVGLGNVDNTADSSKSVLSASKWTTGRVLTLGGDTTGSVSIDGSSDVTLTVSVIDDSHNHAFGNLTGKPTTVAGYGITDVYTKTQTDSNISTAVAGLVNGSPAALDTLNELAAALGNDANFATTVSTSIGTKVNKNADIVGGTNTKITYDAKGLVTSGTSLAATDIPALDWSKITTGKPTTLSGYGISDAASSTHTHSGVYEPAISVGTTAQYLRGDKTWATMPTTLPASDVYAWAKASTKPTYTASEVGALDSNGKAVDSDKLDGIDSTEFMRKSLGNTVTQNLIFNNGGTDTPGIYFASNNSNDINIDMYNGTLRFFRNGGLQPLSIGADNNLYADNGTNGNGRLLTSTTPIGYASGLGVGGTVIQGTLKTDTITLNKLTGAIYTANTTLAAGAIVSFQVNNSFVGGNDNIIVTPFYGYIDPYNYKIELISSWDGGFRVKITNISAGSLSDIVSFKFAIIKGAIS